MIDAPPTKVHYITLMAMENTSLGFACIQGSTLCTWSMKLDTEEAKEWVQNRVVELDKTIPVANPGGQRLVVGFAEGVGVIFVRSAVGLFTVKLNSGQVKKVDGPGVYFSVLPYMSFYTPGGTLKGGVNMEGIKYYNNLINELLSKGVQPFATLFHWDSPQTLEDKYGGFLNPNIINDFKDYAEVCFREFGDRVKHWITFNEPTTFCVGGYASGTSAPGRCSPWERGKCSSGDSGREPYTAGHHLLLAHATAVKLYKEKYQVVQKGEIGITLVSSWYVPLSSSNSDSIAVIRAVDFHLGWFMDPLARGDYPPSMRGLVGNRLPQFTKEQSELLKGAFDFIGLNYYTSSYAGNLPPSNSLMKSYSTDARVNLTSVRNGVAIGPRAASPWLYVYPQGLRELLLYVKDNYGNPTIYITENGVDESNNKSLPLHEGLKDNARIEYHHKHLLALMSAIRDGANAKGYFAWSLLDNFEWSSGYTVRFGLNFVDYDDGLKRYPKLSAHWFKKFLKR